MRIPPKVVLLAWAVFASVGAVTPADPPTTDFADQIRTLIAESLFTEAETRARDLLGSLEGIHGEGSLESCEALDLLVETLWRAGKAQAQETRELAARAVSTKEKVYGKTHAEVATSRRNQAIVLELSGETERAGEAYERVLQIRKQTAGPRSAEAAAAMVDIAIFHYGLAHYEESRSAYEQALEIQIETLGPNDPAVGRTLNNLALLLHAMGELEEARTRFEQTVALKERIAPDSLDLAWTLDAYAYLLDTLGSYPKALELYERALAIRETELPPDHHHIAWTLNNLANLMRKIGDFSEASILYRRALGIQLESLGADHEDTAVTRGNLAELLHVMGDYEESLRLYERTLQVRIALHGEKHPDVGTNLHSMATVLADMGRTDRAREYYTRARSVWIETLGKEDEHYARTLGGLGDLLAVEEKYAQAGKFYDEALTVLEGQLGADHPAVASQLHAKARVLRARGKLDDARASLTLALSIRRQSVGTDHPLTAAVLVDLAEVQARTGNPSLALDAALESEAISAAHFRATAGVLPERQALRLAAVRTTGRDVSLSVQITTTETERIRDVWNSVIASRAAVLDELMARRRGLATVNDPKIVRLWEELNRASRRLANLSIRGPGSHEDVSEYRDILLAARLEKEETEQELAEASLRFRRELDEGAAGIDDISGALPEGAALVAFTVYTPVIAGKRDASERRYMAFVLTGPDAEPRIVPLGRARDIDRRVAEWRRRVAPDKRTATISAESVYRTAAAALRQEIWDPVAKQIGEPKMILVVPDGSVNLVNLSTLPIDDTEYLVGGPPIHYLGAERDVLTAGSRSAPGDGLLALGGASFNREPALQDALRSPGQRSGCEKLTTMQFGHLPSSEREIDQVISLWREVEAAGNEDGSAKASTIVRLTGDQANEAQFKSQAPGRRVLHLATHAFFLGSECASSLSGTRGVGGLAPFPTTTTLGNRPAGESPLLLSGIVLAGANRRDEAGPNQEDGILTAEEVSVMDLAGVEWAVLSACDTGTGAIEIGEGVLGLRRAFQVAGARTVVMSLWPVGDRMARDWMTALYDARIARGMTTAESVRSASLQMLEERRKAGESTHPFAWAVFVAAGDWM